MKDPARSKTLMEYKWIPGEGKGFAIAGVGNVSGGEQYSLKEAYQYMESKVVKGTGEAAKYDVGLYNEIKGVPCLDAHHIGQKAIMKNLLRIMIQKLHQQYWYQKLDIQSEDQKE